MKSLFTGFFAGAVFVASGFTYYCQAETLDEIYQLALANDHNYRAAEAKFAADKEAKNLARAGLLPRINGSYSWTDTEDETSGTQANFDPGQLRFVSNPLQIETHNVRSGYAVSLDQPLFNFAAWNDYKAGSHSAKIAALELSIARQSLIIRTATAYFNTLEAYDSLQTAIAEEKAFSQQLEQSRKRFEVGLTAITEVHESQAAYDSSVAGRLSAEGLFGIAFENLEVITGKPIHSLSPLKSDFPVLLPEPLDRKEWVAFSVENNLSLQISSQTVKQARSTLKARRADHYPTIDGQISYSSFNTDGETGGSESDVDRDTTSFGITLSVPIYNGGSVSAARRQASQQHIQAKENYLQAQRNTIQDARSNHLSVVTGVATVKARKQAITSSQSALDATQSGYEVGTRDLVDVLNAQRNLFAAQRDYQDALYDYIIATLNQKEVAGTLTAKHINELNDWLDKGRTVTYSF